MKTTKYLAVVVLLSVCGCGDAGGVQEGLTDTEESALDATGRLRFNFSGNCVRFDGPNLMDKACVNPQQQWFLDETSNGSGLYRIKLSGTQRCIKIPLNPWDGVPLTTMETCTNTEDTLWIMSAGTVNTTFQLKSFAYPKCFHEDVNTYGFTQNVKAKTCYPGGTLQDQKQRLFVDPI